MSVYVADRVWDGRSPKPIDRGFVRIEDGTISAIGRAADLPDGSSLDDLGDATILPGLINAHVHVTFSASFTVLDDYLGEREAGFDALFARAKQNLMASARAGVTTVRDLGTMNDVVFAARQAVRDGAIAGSDIVAAGEGITSVGGHCWFFGIECDGEDAVRAAVRRQHAAGVDCIKIFATGGNLTPGTDPFAPQFTTDELRACVEESRAAGLHVASHAHATEGIKRSVAAGVDTIEHCTFETPDSLDFDERTVESMAAAGVVAVPTVGASIIEYQRDPAALTEALTRMPEHRRTNVKRIFARMPAVMKNLRRMRELGVTVVAGTDAGIPGRVFEGFPGDIEVLAAPDFVGMGNHAALVGATSGCAHALGLEDRGVLAAGKRADVLVVDGDPLTSVSDLQRTKLVLVAGRLVN